MRNGEGRHSIDLVFILLLFAGFLFTALLLVTMGTKEYHGIVDRMQSNASLRTPAAYLIQTVHQNKAGDAVYIEEIDGIQTLAVEREIAGDMYVDRIYVYEGELREMLTPLGNYDFTLAAGTRILELQALELEERGNAVFARITDGTGRTETGVIAAEP